MEELNMQDEIFMNIAKEYSKFSKCTFTKVAALAVNENKRIIATGVNGTICGEENCIDHIFHSRESHIPYTEENEIHAEENLILEMARSSGTFRSLTIYVTLSPCKVCLKHLLGLITQDQKIKEIVYAEKYHRLSDEDLTFMKEKCKRLGVILRQA